MTESVFEEHSLAPASETQPIGEAMLAIGYTVASPRRAFAILRVRPYWILVFTILSLASIALGAAMKPYNIRAAATALPSDMPADQKGEMIVKWERAQRTAIMLVPVLTFAKLLFGALVIWLLAIAAGRGARFSSAMTVMAHASVIAVIEAWVIFASVARRGIDTIRTPFDLQPSIGLNAFIHSASAPINALLNGVNPFGIWYVVVLAIGIAAVFEMRKLWAAAIATSYWAFTIALQVGIAAIATLVAHSH